MLDCKLDADGGICVTSCGGRANFRDSLTTPTATIPKIFHGLLFRSTLWMILQNLKSVALPVPEIIGGTPKNLGSPWIRPRSLFSNIFMGFYSIRIGRINVLAKFEVCSCTHSRDNMGYAKNVDSPCIRPRSIFSKFLTGFYSEWPYKGIR